MNPGLFIWGVPFQEPFITGGTTISQPGLIYPGLTLPNFISFGMLCHAGDQNPDVAKSTEGSGHSLGLSRCLMPGYFYGSEIRRTCEFLNIFHQKKTIVVFETNPSV